MPSTSRERRLEVSRDWYARNHASAKATVITNRKRYQARNRQIVDEALAERCPCGLADEQHLIMRRLVAHRVARVPSSEAKVRAVIEECPNR